MTLISALLCSTVSARSTRESFTMDGMRRTYVVYLPSSYDGETPAALVVNIHGWAANARMHRWMSQMNPKADEHGFIVVYPEGTGWPRSWNAGNKLGSRREADDVGFIGALIDTMTARYLIDTTRIYAAGFSNGGMMAHRLGCELSSRIAAIAPVAGCLVFTECRPSRPVPVIAFHALNDPVVRYRGDTLLGVHFYSIQDGMETWARLNGCDQDPDTTISEDGKAMRQRWWDADSDMEVILWTTRKGKHSWPGGRGVPAPAVAFPSRAIDANELMWEFFKAHPKPKPSDGEPSISPEPDQRHSSGEPRRDSVHSHPAE